MRSRLTRAVLAVYPRSVRDRYGDEIAEMLASSPRPVRDLADVAWCALADRREGFAVPHPRVRDLALVVLPIAPLAFTAAYFTALLALTILLGRATADGHEVMHLITNVVMLGPMTILAVVWGRRLRRARPIAALSLVVPVALAGVLLALIAIAPGQDFYGLIASSSAAGVPGALAVVSWCAGLIALMLVTAALRKRGRHRLAFVVGVVGAFAVLDFSTVVHVIGLLDPHGAPRLHALLWYPAAISGVDSDLTLGSVDLVGTVGSLSVVLSVCTVFALALTGMTRRFESTPAAEQSHLGTSPVAV